MTWKQKLYGTKIYSDCHSSKIEATKGRADYKKNVAGKFVLVDGDKYALILRLTNMELKSIEQ